MLKVFSQSASLFIHIHDYGYGIRWWMLSSKILSSVKAPGVIRYTSFDDVSWQQHLVISRNISFHVIYQRRGNVIKQRQCSLVQQWHDYRGSLFNDTPSYASRIGGIDLYQPTGCDHCHRKSIHVHLSSNSRAYKRDTMMMHISSERLTAIGFFQ